MPGGREVRVLEIPVARPRGRRVAPAREWLIVGSVPKRAYGEAALERGLQQLEWVAPRALAHEAVVEHFLTAPAVLPMQLFTMFTGDARALEHVATGRRSITAILKRIERQTEWGLRLTWNPEAAARPRPARSGSRAGSGAVSGAAYLTGKRDHLAAVRTQRTQVRAQADRLYRTISREATDARRRTATERAAPGSRLLLDAAFLVPARRTGAFRAAVRRSAKMLEGSGLTVSLTGPWPAYNFI
jgi:Gas vesicle synthesis protein GvpL/GvpF